MSHIHKLAFLMIGSAAALCAQTSLDAAIKTLKFREIGPAVMGGRTDDVAVVEREIGMKQLDDVLPIIGSVADVADQDILVTAAERYSVPRRFNLGR